MPEENKGKPKTPQDFEATEDTYLLHIANMKRTFDAHQDLDLTRARQTIAHTEELNKIFNTHLASLLSDERDHRRELLADRNKRFAYDTAYLYEITPIEALSLKWLNDFLNSTDFQNLLASHLQNKKGV